MGRGRSSSGGSRGSSSSSSRGSSFSSSRGSHYSGRSNHHHYHHHYYGSSSSSRSAFIAFGIFLLIVAIMLIISTISTFSMLGKYEQVNGTVIKNTYSNGWYYTTYAYTVDGVDYENISQEGWEFPESNEQAVIYYKVENPNIITEKEPVNIESCIITSLLCIASSTGAIILLTKAFKKKKLTDSIDADTSTTLTTNTVTKAEAICSYCGTKYDKTLTSCPNCGANRK